MNFANVKALAIPEGNVKQIVDGQGVILWKAVTGPDYTEPFYMETSANSSGTIRISATGGLAPTITSEVSTDRVHWTSVNLMTADYTIPANTRLYIRATSSRNGSWCSQYSSYFTYFSKTALTVGGNIMSLVYGSNFTGQETTFPGSFEMNLMGLFFNSHTISNAENLLLPAALKPYCYYRMFEGATYLLEAPSILPATTLANFCYAQMFMNCKYIKKAPELPAQILVDSCYRSMFNGCSALNNIKCLATSISASNCTNSWVGSVAASGTFTKASGTSWPTGTSGIPSGWSVQNM